MNLTHVAASRQSAANFTSRQWRRSTEAPIRPGWQVDHLNMSGNTLLAGTTGLMLKSACTNVLVLKNDFTSTAKLAVDGLGRLSVDGINSAGALLSAQIIKNKLGDGVSFHLRAPIEDGTHYFLRQNSHLDAGGSPMNLFPEPLELPVHYQP
jgi:hypothetical protein